MLQVDQAGALVAEYLAWGGDSETMIAALGSACYARIATSMLSRISRAGAPAFIPGQNAGGAHALVATARYLAAHSPTVRAPGQTFNIAMRLHRGDRQFEE